MRIDVRSAARSHAFQPLRRSLVPYRTFISRGRTLEEYQETLETIKNEFPHLFPYSWERRSQPNPEARNIAIIGGGITGLSTALFLTKEIPNAKITIFEQKDRLGGWLDSERLKVDGGDVLFEWGPRSLRSDLGGSGYFTESLVSSIVDIQQLWLIFAALSGV